MLIAASAAAHCGRLTAPPIVLCFALFSPLQKQQRRERKQEWQARAAAEFVFCDEQMDPAATTAMAATAAAAGSGGVRSVALGITAHGDAMAKAALESFVASDVASDTSTAFGEIQPNSQANPDAQADVDPDAPNARVVRDLDTCLMDLLNRLDMKFDIVRCARASCASFFFRALLTQRTRASRGAAPW